jgi:hypothetical protein
MSTSSIFCDVSRPSPLKVNRRFEITSPPFSSHKSKTSKKPALRRRQAEAHVTPSKIDTAFLQGDSLYRCLVRVVLLGVACTLIVDVFCEVRTRHLNLATKHDKTTSLVASEDVQVLV